MRNKLITEISYLEPSLGLLSPWQPSRLQSCRHLGPPNLHGLGPRGAEIRLRALAFSFELEAGYVGLIDQAAGVTIQQGGSTGENDNIFAADSKTASGAEAPTWSKCFCFCFPTIFFC